MMQDKRVDVNKQNNNGQTPFYAACNYGHTEVVKHMLQDERVDVNKQDTDGCTPIWMASQNGHTQVVQAILQSVRYIDLDAKWTGNDKTAVEQARQYGYQEIVKLIENYIQTKKNIHAQHQGTTSQKTTTKPASSSSPAPLPSPSSISSSTVTFLFFFVSLFTLFSILVSHKKLKKLKRIKFFEKVCQ